MAVRSGWNGVVGTCLLGAAFATQAGNGLNDAATGVQSGGLANADMTLTNNTAAININPAGLRHIENEHLDFLIEPVLWTVNHHDPIGGTRHPDNSTVTVVGGGYARRLSPQWVAGVGMFFQGGAGFEYKDMPNAFGAPDDVIGLFGTLKIAPGVSWQPTEKLSLGAALGLLYSTAEQELYPHTSVPGFQGFRIDELAGVSTSIRLGLLYELSPRWTLAANYSSKSPIRLRDGRMRINRAGTGQAPLVYRDVSLTGFHFGTELGAGLAFRATDCLTVALDLSWIDWSAAMRSTRLKASRPTDPTAAPVLVVDSPLNWRDQVLVAVGAEYQWTQATLLRAGVSWARRPQREIGLSPAFNLVADRSLGAGFAHRLGERWEVSGSMVLQPHQSRTYDNPLYGGKARETFGAYAGYLGLTRRW